MRSLNTFATSAAAVHRDNSGCRGETVRQSFSPSTRRRSDAAVASWLPSSSKVVSGGRRRNELDVRPPDDLLQRLPGDCVIWIGVPPKKLCFLRC